MKTIDDFRYKYGFLSNFYPCTFVWDGVEWPSVEHAYQAAKSSNKEMREIIRLLPTAGRAKASGQKLRQRPDWNVRKISYMQKFIDLKFAHESRLGDKLLATGDAELIEGNTWGDTFWGRCRGVGRNELGKCLMKRRAVLVQLQTTLATVNKGDKEQT